MYHFILLFVLILACPNSETKAEGFNLDALAEVKPTESPSAIIEEKINPIQDNDEKESPGIFDLLFGSLNKEDADSDTKTDVDATQKRQHINEHFEAGEFFNIAVIKVIDRNIGKLYLLEIPINRPLDFEDLNIKILSCWQPSAQVVIPESRAFLDVQSSNVLKQRKFVANKVFYGWILASHPASSYIHHPKFDISLLECKNQVKSTEPNPTEPIKSKSPALKSDN